MSREIYCVPKYKIIQQRQLLHQEIWDQLFGPGHHPKLILKPCADVRQVSMKVILYHAAAISTIM